MQNQSSADFISKLNFPDNEMLKQEVLLSLKVCPLCENSLPPLPIDKDRHISICFEQYNSNEILDKLEISILKYKQNLEQFLMLKEMLKYCQNPNENVDNHYQE